MKFFAMWTVLAVAGVSSAFFVRSGQGLQLKEQRGPLPENITAAPVAPDPEPPAAPAPRIKSQAELAAEVLRQQGLEVALESLVQAAERGSLSQIELLLKAGVSVDGRAPSGRTPLIAGAAAGDLPAVRKLLDAGANVNAADLAGCTSLIAAAESGAVTVIEALLSRDADLDGSDAEGRTALMHAIAARRLAAAVALLDHQADISLSDTRGRDAFTHAIAAMGDSPLARKLLAAGPRRSSWTAASREGFFQAIRGRDREGIRLYQQKHSAPATLDDNRQTVLAYTIAWNDIDQLRLLLECGADPNVPLSSPAEKEFVQFFPGKMIPHYLTEEKGVTPLMLAAGLGRADFVQTLMEHGARTGAVTAKHKIAALSFAAWAKDVRSQLALLGRAPAMEEQPVRIRISLADQRAYVYKGSEIALTTPVSTGRKGFPTPRGDFVVTDKHFSRMSSLYKVPMPFFMRLSCSEVGMHAGVLPGYPASHGCIRMPAQMAKLLFKQTEVGTPVTIAD